MPVPLTDGRLAVLIPGFPDPELGRYFTLLDLYDPRSDTWTQGAALPQSRHGFAAVQVPIGRLLIVGSHDASHDPAILVEVSAPDGSV